jgi:hypothetical protein
MMVTRHSSAAPDIRRDRLNVTDRCLADIADHGLGCLSWRIPNPRCIAEPWPFSATMIHPASWLLPAGKLDANTGNEFAAAYPWVDRWLDADT